MFFFIKSHKFDRIIYYDKILAMKGLFSVMFFIIKPRNKNPVITFCI
jgi:hypothetical protein